MHAFNTVGLQYMFYVWWFRIFIECFSLGCFGAGFNWPLGWFGGWFWLAIGLVWLTIGMVFELVLLGGFGAVLEFVVIHHFGFWLIWVCFYFALCCCLGMFLIAHWDAFGAGFNWPLGCFEWWFLIWVYWVVLCLFWGLFWLVIGLFFGLSWFGCLLLFVGIELLFRTVYYDCLGLLIGMLFGVGFDWSLGCCLELVLIGHWTQVWCIFVVLVFLLVLGCFGVSIDLPLGWYNKQDSVVVWACINRSANPKSGQKKWGRCQTRYSMVFPELECIMWQIQNNDSELAQMKINWKTLQ